MLTKSKLLVSTSRNIIQKRFGGHVPTPTEARALAKKFGMTMDNLPVRAGDFKELNGAAQAQYTRYMLLGSLFMATSIYFAWTRRVFTTHQVFRYPKSMYDK
ncbi:uncharacterized protein LOC111125552 [Crassostrea virginica]|uniref:Uncharacterized protein LOC111125552 n=1 Tax=Crassostrea virginica TaxID=6565 RepID=A0A8B8DC07_CRAVI|nr:uncharacterized protein LOC111125552 [Crassostrea virginica]